MEDDIQTAIMVLVKNREHFNTETLWALADEAHEAEQIDDEFLMTTQLILESGPE